MSKLIKKSRLTGQPPETLLYEGKAKSEQVRITIIDYDEKDFTEQEARSVEECIPFRNKQSVTWINVDGVHRIDVLEKLTACYLIHHLVLEDILNINQRPKVEDFGEYVYIASKMLTLDAAKDDIAEEQVSMILGKNFLISFQEEKQGDVFDGIRQRIRSGKGRIRKMGPDYLAYALLDAMVDSYFVLLERLGEKIEALEETLVLNPEPAVLQAINKLKRDLIFLRKSVWPLREVVHGLTQMESGLLSENAAVYYRDIYDHVIQVVDTIEAFRDTVSGMLDIYLSSLSHRLNEVMKVLTIIATIFMPLTFIAGIYGMNFNTHASGVNMPELNWRFGYFFALGIMATTACVMIVNFKRKKWF
ncbi:MAG TPA: magnesium/cobalt transporter CorA [Candidatus Omnitrophota bacterium]|nr:magnesium/cobalt transporter CorA [Candidatus Omnitrophota bacterium]